MQRVVSGQSRLSLLFRSERRQVTIENLQDAWHRVREGLDQAIAFVTNNCGIDRPSLLLTKNLLITLCAFFDRFGKDVSAVHSRQLQRWVYMSLIWSRYSSTVETRLDQDYAALAKDEPVKALIQSIEDQVGKRPVTERELQEQRRNSAYMTMSYVLARRASAQDWFSGVAIGMNQPLELHHIFPKAVLREQYDLQADSLTVDQVANLAFLSKRANNRISSTPPDGYLPTIEQSRLRTQYVPMDASLWTLDQFEGFLSERRRLLAEGINGLLRSLDETPSLVSFDDVQVLESRVQTLERRLREFVSQRLDESRGEDAWNTLVPADVRRSVQVRIDRRLETHPYEAGEHETLLQKLAHCQFSDYPKIILANWALFEDVLGKQDTFSQHQRSVTEARNALAHNRPLGDIERASAEAGLLWIEACMRRVKPIGIEDVDEAEEVEENLSVAK